MDPSPSIAARIMRLEDEVAALRALVAPGEAPAAADPTPPRPPRMASIITACARTWDIPVATIHSVRRDRKYAWPRQAAMYLARELGNFSLLRIGRAFGRDHSTVHHAVQSVAARCQVDADFAAKLRLSAALSHTLDQEAPRP